jgi:hypothetical protein
MFSGDLRPMMVFPGEFSTDDGVFRDFFTSVSIFREFLTDVITDISQLQHSNSNTSIR